MARIDFPFPAILQFLSLADYRSGFVAVCICTRARAFQVVRARGLNAWGIDPSNFWARQPRAGCPLPA
jgi:hypothetical protein